MPVTPAWTETTQPLEGGGTSVPATGNGLIAATSPTLIWQDTSLSPNRYFRLQDTGNGFILSTSTDGITFTVVEQITDVTQATVYRRLTGLTLDLTGMAAPAALAERITVGSEANPRWQIDTGGAQSWGPGGATAVDTVFQRIAAAVLQVTGNIRGTVAPSNVADLTRKDYVDAALALKLALAGGTMTGALTLAADPALGLQAATKQYVDNKVGSGLFAEFSGAGAPASGTLSSGVTYLVGNLYLDTTNLNLWVCTTGGSNSTSVWSPVLHTTSNNAFLKVPAWYSGAGAPSGTTLAAGTYAVGDQYWDTTNLVFYICKTAGSATTSVWIPSDQVVTSAGLTLQQTTANYTLLWSNPAAARTLTIPDPLAADTFAFLAAAQTLTNKTLTTPKIATILDANGNTWISVSSTVSAVNFLLVTDAATGVSPTLTFTGTDVNVGGIVTTKGTGGLTIKPGADSALMSQFQTAAGTAVLIVDSLNKRVGVGTAPGQVLDVVGPAAGISMRTSDNVNASAFFAFSAAQGGSARLYSDQNFALGANSADVITLHKLSGNLQFNYALIALGAGAVATLGATGGTGPVTAAQNTWLQLKDSAGNSFWVPVWK